jgi:tetrahydrodipicolinate N-succinyltransferase
LGDQDPTIIGEHVVVGHRAVLHGCTLEDHCLIGMQVCNQTCLATSKVFGQRRTRVSRRRRACAASAPFQHG